MTHSYTSPATTLFRRSACWLVVATGLLTTLVASADVAVSPQLQTLASHPVGAGLARGETFRTVDMQWTDASRQREIPVRLYWPEGASPTAAVPLVIFSHGLGGTRNGYSYLGKYWASQGFASLHVQHAGSDRAVWGSGNIFKMVGNVVAAATEANAIDRVKDVSFAITSILALKEYGPSIQANAIAVAGHSYGANTALHGSTWLG